MPNKFSGGLIARGFAKGIEQGTGIKQAFGQRLGVQAAQKNRDTTYQNFLELMQKKRHTQQNFSDQELHKLSMERIQERQRLEDEAASKIDTDNSPAATSRIRANTIATDQLKLEQFKTSLKAIDDEIEFLQKTRDNVIPEGTFDDGITDDMRTQVAYYNREIIRRTTSRSQFIEEFGGQLTVPGLSKTIRDDRLEREANEKERKARKLLEQSRNPLGLDLPTF
jgi:uncharacterized protein YdiU (UPF0061 family)